MKSPEVFAFEINRTIQAALGDAAYPLKLEDVVHQFVGIHAPGIAVEIVKKPLSSVDGALLSSSDRRRYTILINQAVGSFGRANFTIAHEFGHLLLHRSIRGEFWCGTDQVLGLTSDVVEEQANRFASQLMLPNNLVRRVADQASLSLEDIRSLASRTGASLTATALAVVAMSSKPIGFVVVRDGFVKWGRASDIAYKRGLFFRPGTSVPEGSVANFEGDDSDQSFERDASVEGWSLNDAWKEQGFYSARYNEAYFLITP